jgi:hypothetical protein
VTINAVFWNNFEGFDLHVFPSAPAQPLDALLGVTVNGANHRANSLPAGVTVQFIAEFAGSPSGHGVLVGPNTGTITVSNPRPAVRLNNFLVRAEVKEGGVVFAETPRIRVHVHDRIVFNGVWLTPSALSIHKGSDGQRFSVLAEFDDGVVGDISHFPGITWKSDDDTKIHVDPNTGALSAKVDAGSQEITATLPAPLAAFHPTATAKALPIWATPAKATLVSGPGAAAAADVPNFLFIPEGFVASDKTAFGDMVRQVVDFLGRDSRTSPFNLLKKKINYWMAWIESPQKGASVLHDVAVYPGATQLVGPELELDVAPPPPPSPPAVAPLWTLPELINEVGLPIPSEAIPPGTSDLGMGARYFLQFAAWRTMYGTKIDGRVDIDRYEAWAAMADRRAIDERNSALGLAVGGRPNHENPQASRGIGFHPRRTTRAHLDGFLKLLTDAKTGAAIGTHWGSPAGKDRPFIFALVAGTRMGGMQTRFELIAAALEESSDVKLTAVSGRRVAMDPYKIPRRPSLDTSTTVAHEATHSFDLGDEYGQTGRIPAADVGAATADLNLQDEASLLAAPQPPPVLTGLDGNKLKWRWPRIARAAVLTGFPTAPASGGFEIPIEAQPDEPFEEGDVVQVRARPLKQGIVPCDQLVIKSGGAQAKKLIVEAVTPPVTITPMIFGKGSVVYKPVIDLLPLGTGKPLMLVHEKVRDHITTTGLPLNAPRTATLQRSCGDEGQATPDAQQGTLLPPTLVLPKGGFTHWVVGAFEGGGDFQCGIYHPAGACLMRNLVFYEPQLVWHVMKGTFTWEIEQLVFTLCPVCRYVMVDKLDPTQHGAVDKWYQKRYPG